MPAVRFNQFAGELPAVHPDKLPEENAQRAENVRLLSGALEAWHEPDTHRSLSSSSPRTVFRTQYGSWLEFPERRHVVNSVHSNDPYNRVFFTGSDIAPSVSNYSQAVDSDTPAYYRLGVPVPEKATGSVVDSDDSDGDDGDEYEEDEKRTYYYAVTFVNEFGEEGPPCEAAGPFEVSPDQTVELELPRIDHFDNPDNVAFDENQVPLVECYIYRSSGGSFQFIASTDVGSDTFKDTVEAGAAAEALESEEWYPPPDNLNGLTVVAGGFLAAYRHATDPNEEHASAGNEVLFSEANLPHAWPTAYRLPVDYEVVALGSFGQTLVVLTKGSVFMGKGADPGSVTLENTNIQQPCIAEESVVSLHGGVVYASPDGLVYVTGQGPEVITEGVLTRREWDRYRPETIRASSWYHLYVAFYDGEDGSGAFAFDPRRSEQGIVHFDMPYPSAVFTDLEEDELYFAEGDELKRWNAGSRMTFKWRSRSMTSPRPFPVRVVRVWADEYPVDIQIYREGSLQDAVSVSGREPIRIEGGTLARNYEVEVEGRYPVHDITLASSMVALMEA